METIAINLLGWVAMALIVIGFWLNSKRSILGLYVFIFGDALWIIYDILIHNPQHALLSILIILINIKGVKQWKN